MKKSAGWTRREFVKRAGVASLAAAAAGPLRAGTGRVHASLPRFVYVGSAEGHIAVFVAGPGVWKQVQEIAAARPSSLVLHPGKDVLYAVNEIDLFDHLPCGSVEAYAIGEDGCLSLLSRQPLSLSATAPRHAAVSPDGRMLVVAVHGGGAYNAFPICEDGSLGRLPAILKETGFGPDEEHQRGAHPQRVIFDGMGRVLSTDMGSDHLNVFRMEDGRLRVLGRRHVDTGSGPRQMELHPNGNLLFVANALEASVASYGYDSGTGRILDPLCRVSLNSSARGAEASVAMTMHPSGEFLYTACGLSAQGVVAWRIDTRSGFFKPVREERMGNSVDSLVVTAGGSRLLSLGSSAGTVTCWQIDAQGRHSNPLVTARVRQPVSMAVKYA